VLELLAGETFLLWLETIIYGHGSDEHQNPRKIRVFNGHSRRGFLARGDREGRAVAKKRLSKARLHPPHRNLQASFPAV